MSNWTLHHGECIEFLRTLPNKSVDHVITDPPYEEEAHTKGRRVMGRKLPEGGRKIKEHPLSFPPITEIERRAVGKEIARVCRRWALVFCQIEAAHLWREALHPLSYRRTCVWVKPDGQPQYTGDRPGIGYETIVVCHPKGKSTWNGGGRVGVFTHNTLTGARAAWNAKIQDAQKPVSLMMELVNLFTDPGELILDPYTGSATTGVAALRLGRRFLGVERVESSYQNAMDRLTAEGQTSELHALRARQLPLFQRAGS